MKVWIVYSQYYEDQINCGIFSSYEKAKESAEHWKTNERNWIKDYTSQVYIDEYNLDEYHHFNLSPLAKAMSEQTPEEEE